MEYTEFKREDHVYSDNRITELVKDAVLFFSGTPVVPLPLPEKFKGAGVYAIYCTARSGLYAPYGDSLNRTSWDVPIYVGKAIPKGWRQSRIFSKVTKCSALYSRLCQHATSISEGKGVSVEDFACRFAIFEDDSADIIAAIEAAIISKYKPLWNSVIDGFGNHDPGGKRSSGKKTQWDSLHPGRKWTKKMTGSSFDPKVLKQRVTDYLIGRVDIAGDKV